MPVPGVRLRGAGVGVTSSGFVQSQTVSPSPAGRVIRLITPVFNTYTADGTQRRGQPRPSPWTELPEPREPRSEARARSGAGVWATSTSASSPIGVGERSWYDAQARNGTAAYFHPTLSARKGARDSRGDGGLRSSSATLKSPSHLLEVHEVAHQQRPVLVVLRREFPALRAVRQGLVQWIMKDFPQSPLSERGL